MAEWSKRRNWQIARACLRDSRWVIELDEKPLRTPANKFVALPTFASAALVAREWDGQKGILRPESMPFTKLAISAVDEVAPSRERAAASISGYGAADLICYKAESPPDLVERQEYAWRRPLDWCEDEIGAKLNTTQGVAFVAQPPSSLSRLKEAVANLNEFELAALFELVSLTGSLVLGLAIERGFMRVDEAWRASRVDEDWQLEKWGHDAEAIATSESRKQDMKIAFEFLEATRNKNGDRTNAI
ncbi:MAG: ATPase [Albidovulum sp.]|nr:ATPase [Albidovulum sp.]MDE0534589.1 ATPase [Albidovulum sp.]